MRDAAARRRAASSGAADAEGRDLHLANPRTRAEHELDAALEIQPDVDVAAVAVDVDADAGERLAPLGRAPAERAEQLPAGLEQPGPGRREAELEHRPALAGPGVRERVRAQPRHSEVVGCLDERGQAVDEPRVETAPEERVAGPLEPLSPAGRELPGPTAGTLGETCVGQSEAVVAAKGLLDTAPRDLAEDDRRQRSPEGVLAARANVVRERRAAFGSWLELHEHSHRCERPCLVAAHDAEARGRTHSNGASSNGIDRPRPAGEAGARPVGAHRRDRQRPRGRRSRS